MKTVNHFIFHCNNSTSFETVFCILQVDYSKNICKEENCGHDFFLSFGWLNISANKLLKTAILLGQELIKYEK